MKNDRISDGVWPVMLTPFKRRDCIDWAGLQDLTDWYISQGVHGLFSACLSSEALEMSDENKLALVKRVVEIADGRVPVVAGVMGVSSREKRIEMILSMLECGADAAVMTLCDIVPQKASDEEWIGEMECHLEYLRGCPLGVYECPLPYRRMLTPVLTDYIAQRPEFLFLKETSCDIKELKRKRKAGRKSGLKVFSADAKSVLNALREGMNGFSGLQTNLWPALHVKLFECWHDDPDLAERLQNFFIEYNWVLDRSYPASAKQYLHMAYGLNIGNISFLNNASVDGKDSQWIKELVSMICDFEANVAGAGEMLRTEAVMRT